MTVSCPHCAHELELLTVPEVADHLGLTTRRVRELARSRKIGARIGRDIVFTHPDLERFANRRPGRPPKDSTL